MKTTYRQLRLAFIGLDYIIRSFNDLKMSTGTKVRKTKRLISDELKDFTEEEKKLIERYVKEEGKESFTYMRGQDGEVLGYQAAVKENQKELDEKWKELLDTEVELSGVRLLTVDDFARVDGKEREANWAFLELLGPFFDEDAEQPSGRETM